MNDVITLSLLTDLSFTVYQSSFLVFLCYYLVVMNNKVFSHSLLSCCSQYSELLSATLFSVCTLITIYEKCIVVVLTIKYTYLVHHTVIQYIVRKLNKVIVVSGKLKLKLKRKLCKQN